MFSYIVSFKCAYNWKQHFTLETTVRFPICMNSYFWKPAFRANDFAHWGQLNGFLLVGTLKCFFKLISWVNDCAHWEHLNGFNLYHVILNDSWAHMSKKTFWHNVHISETRLFWDLKINIIQIFHHYFSINNIKARREKNPPSHLYLYEKIAETKVSYARHL